MAKDWLENGHVKWKPIQKFPRKNPKRKQFAILQHFLSENYHRILLPEIEMVLITAIFAVVSCETLPIPSSILPGPRIYFKPSDWLGE